MSPSSRRASRSRPASCPTHAGSAWPSASSCFESSVPPPGEHQSELSVNLQFWRVSCRVSRSSQQHGTAHRLPLSSREMTLKRVRRYALLAGIALWTVFAVDYATPGPLDRVGKIKGTDFVQFYATGSIVGEGHADRLYDNDTL